MNELLREALEDTFKNGTVVEKVELYNFMFVCVAQCIASDLPREDVEEHREEIKTWLKDELGSYNDAEYVLNIPEQHNIEIIDLLNEIYKEAEEEENDESSM